MSFKIWITIGILVGSSIGGYIPAIWGNSFLSFSSILGSLLGGLVGIWMGYKLSQNLS